MREDIPSKQLRKHIFTKNVEGLFVELNLRKTKILFFGGYRSEDATYGLSKSDFFEQLGFALDAYSNNEKFLFAGDFRLKKIRVLKVWTIRVVLTFLLRILVGASRALRLWLLVCRIFTKWL